jgi:hypothetical protein
MNIDPPYVRSAIKQITGYPVWGPVRSGRQEFVLPLQIGGAIVPGLQLRGVAVVGVRDQAVTLQLEYPHDEDRTDNAIDRLDWRPLHTHHNGGRGPAEYRYLRIKGSHHHAFELNWLRTEGRMRHRNLPIAVPLTREPADVSNLLDFAADCFNIKGLTAIRWPDGK